MFDAVIFDCDGVLIDSEILTLEIELSKLANLGVVYDLEEYGRRFLGLDDKNWTTTILGAHPGLTDHVETLISDCEAAFDAAVANGLLRAVAGVEEAIHKLAIPKAVASSSASASLTLKLARTGLLQTFAPHIYSADLVGSAKPDPDIFLYAAAKLGVPPHRCLAIEDSRNGILSAKAAGMHVWGFVGGGHCGPATAATLEAAGAARIVRSWSEALPAPFA